MRALGLIAAVVLAFPSTPHAGEAQRRCADAGLPPEVCAAVDTIETGLQRPGASVADLTREDVAEIEIADFYFAPRAAVIGNGQTVRFLNTNPHGGNVHSVASSDWGGTSPALPAPVAGFGGGVAFRSGKLGPGEPFTVFADVNVLDEAGWLLLPNGDAIIPYHCYIHGSAQMSGFLVVRDAAV